MDNSKEFQFMLDKAIKSEPLAFKNFDRTKNVQDQLQEMLTLNSLKDCRGILYVFTFWAKKGHGATIFTSMEQLWLAFVMKEKYNKVWDRENWIKEGGT